MSEPSSLQSPSKIRAGVGAFFFVSGFGFATWASRIPALQQKMHLNDAQLGSTLFAMPLGLMLTLPLTSYLLGKYSSRYIMLIGSSMYALLLCILGFVTQTWQFVIVLFFFGSSRNLMNIPTNAQSVGVQSLYNKYIISSFHGIWSVSGFTAAGFGAMMISRDISPGIHFLIAGFLMAAIMFFSFKHTFTGDLPQSNATKRPAFALPNRPLIKLGVIAFCAMAAEGIMYDWSGIYFQNIIQAPKNLQGMGYVAFMCAAATGRFTGDWFVNRIGVKKVMQISGILIASGLLIAIFLPYLITATLGFIFTGLGASCLVPLIMSLSGKAQPESPGQAIASVSTISYIGFLLGPPIIGYVAQAANLKWSFSIGVLLGLCVVVLVSKIKIGTSVK
ncbi:MFS transporter [Chitinophagaceae bacterium LWZ2-11]